MLKRKSTLSHTSFHKESVKKNTNHHCNFRAHCTKTLLVGHLYITLVLLKKLWRWSLNFLLLLFIRVFKITLYWKMWYFILNVFFYFSIFFTKASWLVVLGLKFLWCLVCRSLFDLFHFRKFAYRAFCYLNNANIGPILAKNISCQCIV